MASGVRGLCEVCELHRRIVGVEVRGRWPSGRASVQETEGLRMLSDELGEFGQWSAACGRGEGGPCWEGADGGLDGGLDVCCRCFGDCELLESL